MCERADCQGTRLGRGAARKHPKGLEIGEGEVVGQCDLRDEGNCPQEDGFCLKEGSPCGMVGPFREVVGFRIRLFFFSSTLRRLSQRRRVGEKIGVDVQYRTSRLWQE